VQCGDRRLGLVGTELVAAQGSLEDHHAVGDQGSIPECAVLFGERCQSPVGADPGTASVVQEHQGEQTPYLRLVDHGRELPREPDGLGTEVDIAGVALGHRRSCARRP
jgi:hypothetical protein